jgi:small-conductance mechanosensitive channel
MEELITQAKEWLAIPWLRASLVVAAAIVIGKAVDLILCRAVRQLTRRSETDLDDALIEQLHRPIFLSVVLVGLYLSVGILGMPAPYSVGTIRVIQTIGLFTWLFALLRTCTILIDGFGRLVDRVTWLEARTIPLFDNLAKITLFSGAIYIMLKIWSLDVAPWLASAGIVGIALGFAAKDSLANLFGGIFVIMDSPYQIGDYINLDSGERGKVIKIGLRSTRLLTRDDVEVTVPNGVIANAKVVNESGGPWQKRRVAVTVGVAYGSNVTQVNEVLMKSAVRVEWIASDPPPRVRFTEMGDSALIFRVLGWISEPELRGRAIDGLNTAIYEDLNAAGIEIPFPQRTVHHIGSAGR